LAVVTVHHKSFYDFQWVPESDAATANLIFPCNDPCREAECYNGISFEQWRRYAGVIEEDEFQRSGHPGVPSGFGLSVDPCVDRHISLLKQNDESIDAFFY
jgi:hypothetical protein